MDQYIVTIAPVDPDGSPAEARSSMTVRVEVSGGEAHVVELVVRALAQTDLAEGGLPPVDLQRLAQAFSTSPARVEPARHSSGPPSRTGRKSAVAKAGAQPAQSPAVAAAGDAASGDTASGGTAPKRAATKETAAGEKAPAHEPAVSETVVPAARAYRRMPDPVALQAVYAEVGSIAGVAKHFDVPTHTAQGWIGRLRKLGQTAAVS